MNAWDKDWSDNAWDKTHPSAVGVELKEVLVVGQRLYAQAVSSHRERIRRLTAPVWDQDDRDFAARRRMKRQQGG